MRLDAIINLVPIDERVATAGQPTAEQLADVAAAGYTVVINLATGGGQQGPPDEGDVVARLGMAYHPIPVVWSEPRLEDFQRFVDCMDESSAEPCFVHCALNYRVSMFTALYGQLRWGWPLDRAQGLATTFWTPDATWSTFIDAVRQRWGLDGVGEG